MAESLFYSSVYRSISRFVEFKNSPINLKFDFRSTLDITKLLDEIRRFREMMNAAIVTFDLQRRYQGSIPDEDYNLAFNADGLIPLNPDCMYVVAAMAAFYATGNDTNKRKIQDLINRVQSINTAAEQDVANENSLTEQSNIYNIINDYSKQLVSVIDNFYTILSGDNFDNIQIVNITANFDFPNASPDPVTYLKTLRARFASFLSRPKLHVNTYLVGVAKEFVDYFLNFSKVRSNSNLTSTELCLFFVANSCNILLNTAFHMQDDIRNCFYGRFELPRYLTHENFYQTINALVNIELNNQVFETIIKSYKSASEYIRSAKSTTYRIKKWWTLTENICYNLFVDQTASFVELVTVFNKLRFKIEKYFNPTTYTQAMRVIDAYSRSGIMKYFTQEANEGVTGTGAKYKAASILKLNELSSDEKLVCDILFNTVNDKGVYGDYNTSKDTYELNPNLSEVSQKVYRNRCRLYPVTVFVAKVIKRYFRKIEAKDVFGGCQFFYDIHGNHDSITSVIRRRVFDCTNRVCYLSVDSHNVVTKTQNVTSGSNKANEPTISGDRLYSLRYPDVTSSSTDPIIKGIVVLQIKNNLINPISGRYRSSNDVQNNATEFINDSFVGETIDVRKTITATNCDCHFFGNFNDIAEYRFRTSYHCKIESSGSEKRKITVIYNTVKRLQDISYDATTQFVYPSNTTKDLITFGNQSIFTQSQNNSSAITFKITFSDDVDEFGDRVYNGDIMRLLYTIDPQTVTDLDTIATSRIKELDRPLEREKFIELLSPSVQINREYPLMEAALNRANLKVYDSVRDTIYANSSFGPTYKPKDLNIGNRCEIRDGNIHIKRNNYSLPFFKILPSVIELTFTVDNKYERLETIQEKDYSRFKSDPVEGIIATEYDRNTKQLIVRLSCSNTLQIVKFKRDHYRLNNDAKGVLIDYGTSILNQDFNSPSIYIEHNGRIVKYNQINESPLVGESFIGLSNSIPGRLCNIITNCCVALFQKANNRTVVGSTDIVDDTLCINILARCFKCLSQNIPADFSLRLIGLNTERNFSELYSNTKKFVNDYISERNGSNFTQTLADWKDVIICLDKDKVNRDDFFSAWACAPVTHFSDSVEKVDYVNSGGALLPAVTLASDFTTVTSKWKEWFDQKYVDYLYNLVMRYIDYCIVSGTERYYTTGTGIDNIIDQLFSNSTIVSEDKTLQLQAKQALKEQYAKEHNIVIRTSNTAETNSNSTQNANAGSTQQANTETVQQINSNTHTTFSLGDSNDTNVGFIIHQSDSQVSIDGVHEDEQSNELYAVRINSQQPTSLGNFNLSTSDTISSANNLEVDGSNSISGNIIDLLSSNNIIVREENNDI